MRYDLTEKCLFDNLKLNLEFEKRKMFNMNIKKIIIVSCINLLFLFGLFLFPAWAQDRYNPYINVRSIPPNEIKIDNDPESSRGIKWGTNINELDGMNLVSKDELHWRILSDDEKNDDNLEVYTKVGDKLKIGDANIEKIYYFFYKDRFCRIGFYFSSSSDYYKIKETLFHAYGEIEVKMSTSPSSPLMSSTYLWVGEKVKLKLGYYKETVRFPTMPRFPPDYLNMNKQKKVERYPGELSVFYKPIWNEEIEKDRQRRIEEGSKDL